MLDFEFTMKDDSKTKSLICNEVMFLHYSSYSSKGINKYFT